MDSTEVRGMGEAMKQAKEGLKLLTQEQEAMICDVDAATAFKAEMDAKIKTLEEEAAALTGKDNKKARTEKDKAKTAIKNQHDYIDACKIVKGLDPVHGHFVKYAPKKPEPVAEVKPEEVAPQESEKKETKAKAKKAQESAGISHAERDELEGLKKKIVEKKTELKAEGMSGGQINKHADIVKMVARMNELKEKENPGSSSAKETKKETKKKSGSMDQATIDAKQKELDEYMLKMKNEFKYSKKEMKADPDYMEMKAELDKLIA